MKQKRKVLRAAEQVARVEEARDAYLDRYAVGAVWHRPGTLKKLEDFARLLEAAQVELNKAKEVKRK